MGYLTKEGSKRNKTWHKGSLGDEDDARTWNTRSAEKACDSTLDNENTLQHVTSVFIDGAQ